MDERSDGSLLADFAAGDSAALGALVDRHQAPLLRHARSLLGDGAGHEDAVQEAFLRLVEKPPAIPPEALGEPLAERAALSSWLHRVVRNCCMDTLRSETRRKRREEGVATTEASSGGLAGVEERDTRAAVEASLDRLPPDQREVLVLRLLAERSYKEIAEITGRKIGTVGWLVSVGLKALADELTPLLGGAPGRPLTETRSLGLAQGERP